MKFSYFLSALYFLRPYPRSLPALLFCFAVAPCAVQAQVTMISDGINIRSDFGYELVGRLRDRILLFRDKYNEFEVQAFDPQLRLSWSRKIEDLDRKGIQILGTAAGKNDFSVIHKARKRSNSAVRVHKYDPGANLIDTMTVKDYGDRLFNAPSVQLIASDDRNCFAIVNDGERNKLEVTCFRLDRMQVLWDKTIDWDTDAANENLKGMVLGNDGTFFLITERNNRRGKLDDHFYGVLQLGGASERVAVIPLSEFLTGDAKFIVDNQHKTLIGAGLYAEKNKDRVNGTFHIVLGLNDTTASVRFTPFDDKFVSILRQKDVQDNNRGVADAVVRQLVLREDGGVLLLAERQREVQRGTTTSRGFARDGMRMVVDFYYDDLFIIAMQPAGDVQWKTVLHKKQYSQDDGGTFSSFFLWRSPDKLRVLFNDEIKYENTCSEYVISPLGDFDRNAVLNTLGQSLRLRFRDALQINAAECLVPSEHRNKLRLVLMRF